MKITKRTKKEKQNLTGPVQQKNRRASAFSTVQLAIRKNGRYDYRFSPWLARQKED